MMLPVNSSHGSVLHELSCSSLGDKYAIYNILQHNAELGSIIGNLNNYVIV